MNIKVDQDKCIGCGSCVGICDTVFDYNEEGLATVINDSIDDETLEDVKDAAENCPTEAIILDEEK